MAVLPGLINAHTHLEFSRLARPLGRPGMSFPDWLREVIRWRDATPPQDWDADRDSAIRQGLEVSRRCGTTTIGEIARLPWRGIEQRYESMQGVAFLELLGLASARYDELFGAASEYVEARRGKALSPHAGLSPHALYTASPKLVESVAALSARTRTPVAMHIAETREELELLREGSGPFREFLDELGAWHPDLVPLRSTALDYLKLLAKADRSLIIHGNYLSPHEIEFAGRQSERMSVIYCARTHAYFGHDRYPLREMLDAGVNVALGTDSRASNPDLNMLSELRFAARHHQDIPLETILRLATSHAATALGMAATLGTLTPGKQGDFIVLPVSPHEPADPHELLFDSAQSVQQVFRSGAQIHTTNI
ncbi:MAG: amidohydrolase family protein [Planctomycetota bacterium]|nr:amidohydrolase family protein [Planctomycetota bacterium]